MTMVDSFSKWRTKDNGRRQPEYVADRQWSGLIGPTVSRNAEAVPPSRLFLNYHKYPRRVLSREGSHTETIMVRYTDRSATTTKPNVTGWRLIDTLLGPHVTRYACSQLWYTVSFMMNMWHFRNGSYKDRPRDMMWREWKPSIDEPVSCCYDSRPIEYGVYY